MSHARSRCVNFNFAIASLLLSVVELVGAAQTSTGLTACQNQQLLASRNGPPAPGAFVPQCDTNGNFRVVQCHPSTGYCWCADPQTGTKIPATDVPPGSGQPNCGGSSTTGNGIGQSGTFSGGQSSGPTKCQAEVNQANANANAAGQPILGAFIPQCDSNGNYKQLQCSGSTGRCWCADPQTGAQIPGTDVPPGSSGPPNCASTSGNGILLVGSSNTATGQSKCQAEVQQANANSAVLGRPIIGRFVPQCDSNGNYNQVQCSGSTGYCWCVDPPTGTKVPGTDVPPGSNGRPNCAAGGNNILIVSSTNTAGAGLSKCQTEVQRANANGQPLIGAFVPQCDTNGNYKQVQCSGSTGFCWCVDPNSGTKLVGTDIRGSAPNCAGGGATLPTSGKCSFVLQLMAQSNSAQFPPGTPPPQCDSNGDYQPMQCQASSGFCWCVDPKNGTKIFGTDVGPGQRPSCASVSATAPNSNNAKSCVQQLLQQFNGTPPPGAQVQQCDPSGNFKPVQCSGSTGRCWCVDPLSGARIPGTDVGPGQTATCAANSAPIVGISGSGNCNSQRQQILQQFNGIAPPGALVPQCDPNGNFQQVQCSGSTGRCWCVDPIVGSRIQGTEVGPGQTANCNTGAPQPVGGAGLQPSPFGGALSGSCNSRKQQLQQQFGGILPPGTPVPQCDQNGNFQRQQCNGGSGFCWCVDPISGAKIPGTDTSPGRSMIDCNGAGGAIFTGSSGPTGGGSFFTGSSGPAVAGGAGSTATSGGACLAEQQRITQQYNGRLPLDLKIPTCTSNGDYAQTQCGMVSCWCVDAKTGQKTPNSDRALSSIATQGPPNCGATPGAINTTPNPSGSGTGSAFNPGASGSASGTNPTGACLAEQQRLNQSFSGQAPPADFRFPTCSPNGDYSPIQCGQMSCWCVDVKTGQKNAASERPFSQIQSQGPFSCGN